MSWMVVLSVLDISWNCSAMLMQLWTPIIIVLASKSAIVELMLLVRLTMSSAFFSSTAMALISSMV